jgi:dTDP-4-dehydrorhamnose reductase
LKILVTGGKGQLGAELQNTLKDEHEVIAYSRKQLDVLDYSKVQEQICGKSPDIVVHCAAFTDVDGSELNPEKAYSVNAFGTQNVAIAAEHCGAALVFVSTDYVFDGAKGEPYMEFDQPNPINIYGKSKYAGERMASSLCRKHYIVRTSWLFGRFSKNNFVRTVLGLIGDRNEIRVVCDQVGSPTCTYDLSLAIKELIKSERYGLYHIANEGEVSWYQFTQLILDCRSITGVQVIPITTDELDRPAERPSYSALQNFCLNQSGLFKMRSFEDSLEEYLAGI